MVSFFAPHPYSTASPVHPPNCQNPNLAPIPQRRPCPMRSLVRRGGWERDPCQLRGHHARAEARALPVEHGHHRLPVHHRRGGAPGSGLHVLPASWYYQPRGARAFLCTRSPATGLCSRSCVERRGAHTGRRLPRKQFSHGIHPIKLLQLLGPPHRGHSARSACQSEPWAQSGISVPESPRTRLASGVHRRRRAQRVSGLCAPTVEAGGHQGELPQGAGRRAGQLRGAGGAVRASVRGGRQAGQDRPGRGKSPPLRRRTRGSDQEIRSHNARAFSAPASTCPSRRKAAAGRASSYRSPWPYTLTFAPNFGWMPTIAKLK
jgi:hypothetical protein